MRKPELAALTGIRFYAAMFVFLSHVTVIPGMEALSGGKTLFNSGVVGVSFFFVLSGFILTYNYADVLGKGVTGSEYKHFVWARLTKIYPVHILALLMVLPVALSSPNLPLDWRALPVHLLLLQCFWPSTSPNFYHFLNVPSWSISCEWFFYLLAPFAIYLALGGLRRRWLLFAPVALYVVALGWLLEHNPSDYSRLYFVSWFAPSRFVEFLAGILLARRSLADPVRLSFRLAVFTQFLGLSLIIAGALYRSHAPWPFWGGLLYLPGSTLLVMGLARGGGALATHLSGPRLNRLGMASYSLYLIHAPLLRAVKGVCLHFGLEVRDWTGFWMVTIVMFLFVQSVVLLVYYGYETPLQRRLRGLLRAALPPRKSLEIQHEGLEVCGLSLRNSPKEQVPL